MIFDDDEVELVLEYGTSIDMALGELETAVDRHWGQASLKDMQFALGVAKAETKALRELLGESWLEVWRRVSQGDFERSTAVDSNGSSVPAHPTVEIRLPYPPGSEEAS